MIVRLSALGDVIHTIPAVTAIRRSRPGFAIGWAIEGAYRELVEAVTPVDIVFPVELRKWRRRPFSAEAWTGLFGVLRQMRRFVRGCTSIDFQGLLKSAALVRISGAKERIGFDPDFVRERASSWFTNRRIAVDPDSHVIEMNMRLAEAVGAEPIDPLAVDFSHYPVDRSGFLWVQVSDGPVLLLPGASVRDKCWPASRYAALAERIRADGYSVLVGWGPGEEDLARKIAEQTPAVRVAPPTDLRELAYLIQNSSCVVGSDTGPLHLAAALRKPVVGLYGPTNPHRNGPWKQIHRCVEVWSRSRRMDEIEPEDVMDKVRDVLADRPV
ncbi:MAG: lipopolysaccharide heptosyltransferase I [Thermoanaerobaculia bacterium]|nr:lipopolysaccharide heptosyltransferase I [Thermoanaerobaculia bacterium]